MNFSEQINQNLESFIGGLSVFFVGIVMVFIALILLIILITLTGKLVAKIESGYQSKEKTQNYKLGVGREAEEPIMVYEAISNEETETDEMELVAVITATIAMNMGTTTDQLRVRSLRKITR